MAGATADYLSGCDKLSFWIELTEQCQLRCRYCYNSWRSYPSATHSAMPLETIDRIVRTVADNPVPKVQFILAGGDPSAHPDLLEILKRLNPIGDVDLITHGADLSDTVKSLLEGMDNCSVQFSIPSYDHETYKFLCGRDALDDAIGNAVDLANAGVDCLMSSVISRPNLDHVPGLVYLASRLDMDALLLNRFLPSGRGAHYEKAFMIDEGEWNHAIDLGEQAGVRHKVDIAPVGPSPKAREYRIANPRLTISVDGNIRLCNLVEDSFAHIDNDLEKQLKGYFHFWKSGGQIPQCFCSMQ